MNISQQSKVIKNMPGLLRLGEPLDSACKHAESPGFCRHLITLYTSGKKDDYVQGNKVSQRIQD